jgi:ring-1,2-phenylacetyl-CoA epoxidase subunit PaaD
VVNAATAVPEVETAWAAAASVPDPEVPVLTVADLGVLRDVRVADDGSVDVDITPTYSGCPAMHTIEHDVVDALHDKGFREVRVHTRLTPAWTTDWMSDAGRRKLAEYGIAPPGRRAAGGPVPLTLGTRPGTTDRPTCPQCGSADVRELSHFGSTACKSLWQCTSCREPFDHFKAI